MKPYVFLLRKLNHEGKYVIHSSWIGEQRLSSEVIHHKMPLAQMRQELERSGYRLLRLA